MQVCKVAVDHSPCLVAGGFPRTSDRRFLRVPGWDDLCGIAHATSHPPFRVEGVWKLRRARTLGGGRWNAREGGWTLTISWFTPAICPSNEGTTLASPCQRSSRPYALQLVSTLAESHPSNASARRSEGKLALRENKQEDRYMYPRQARRCGKWCVETKVYQCAMYAHMLWSWCSTDDSNAVVGTVWPRRTTAMKSSSAVSFEQPVSS